MIYCIHDNTVPRPIDATRGSVWPDVGTLDISQLTASLLPPKFCPSDRELTPKLGRFF